MFQGGAAWRKRLIDDIGDQGVVTALIERRSDGALADLMTNLGGHDLPSLVEAFSSAGRERPICFICYTIKGVGLPFAGHKDNHAGLMTVAQMEVFRRVMNVRPGHEWDKFEGLPVAPKDVQAFLDAVPFAARRERRHRAEAFAVPSTLPAPSQAVNSTQAGFGAILSELGKDTSPFVERIVTTSPDVTVSTNLGAWVNRRKLFNRETTADVFRSEHIASTFNWSASPQGQHIELGIAEMNLFILLSGLGLSHEINGERLFPIGTIYDPFIARGLDALNYACYQNARFILVGTPSGLTLAPEGGAHQSIGTPLIGMAQDGLAAFEPAFVDELAVVLAFGFDYLQRDGSQQDKGNGLHDGAGGSLYLRLSTRPIEQMKREISADLRRDIIDGGYWLRRPGPNCQAVVAYMGAVAPEAIQAVGLMGEDRRDIGLLAVTSADRLNAGWTAAQRAREAEDLSARSHVERLLADVPTACGIVTVLDGHPATLAWLGSVHGHRVRALGVEHFGQTGSIADLYRHYGIDAAAIMTAAQTLTPGRPIRHLRVVR